MRRAFKIILRDIADKSLRWSWLPTEFNAALICINKGNASRLVLLCTYNRRACMYVDDIVYMSATFACCLFATLSPFLFRANEAPTLKNLQRRGQDRPFLQTRLEPSVLDTEYCQTTRCEVPHRHISNNKMRRDCYWFDGSTNCPALFPAAQQCLRVSSREGEWGHGC